jgi:lauroyl/myristoyl acyltransferase
MKPAHIPEFLLFEHAYPEISRSDRRGIARQSFRSVGEATLELACLAHMTPDLVWREVILSIPMGLKWIPVENAVRDTVEGVKRGEVIILVADQTAARESVWVSFFGREVPTPKGPAALALKTGAPLFLSEENIRKDPGQWMWTHKRWKLSSGG